MGEGSPAVPAGLSDAAVTPENPASPVRAEAASPSDIPSDTTAADAGAALRLRLRRAPSQPTSTPG